ncbi:MAG: preprotein translocase subunit SecE [Thermomicrobiales bacterium]|nr:preprotein translocase subunit SecE [Thermomicrobiales bacterium]
MSAQRRTITKTQRPPTSDVDSLGSEQAASVAPARPPRPVAPKPTEEPTSAIGRRVADLKQNYLDTVAELKKVNWPDRETTKNLTLVVIGISVVLGLLLGGVDYILQTIFRVVG